MYGLPSDFDGSFFIGCRLQMVCFNINQIYLHFSNDVVVTVEGGFLYRKTETEQEYKVVEPPILSSDLMCLLEHKIEKVVWDDVGTIKMIFENGHVFECYDSFSNYESYKIKHADKTIII